MKNIIVTVKDIRESFVHDMEIPTYIPMKLVIDKMVANLMLLHHTIELFQRRFKIVCSRTGKTVNPNKTAEECGIWNGDYLIFSEE